MDKNARVCFFAVQLLVSRNMVLDRTVGSVHLKIELVIWIFEFQAYSAKS